MKAILSTALLLIATFSLAQGQTQKQVAEVNAQTEAESAAKAELKAAAQAYKAGKFAEAQLHAEKALGLDPTSKTAALFIARAKHAQYRPSLKTPENTAQAREAINAYQKIAEADPLSDEAFKAVASLYGSIGEDALQYSWILALAANGAVPAQKRAEAYAILASKDWNCSYDITERADVKQTEMNNDRLVITYRKPKDQKDFERARQCASNGMEHAEAAILLAPENEVAWSFKANLRLEMAKLADMEGDKNRRAEYERLAEEDQVRVAQLHDKRQRESDLVIGEGETSNASPSNSDSTSSKTISGGVLNGKAISKPAPAYPPLAIKAHVEGIVIVQITVDEEGKVISATAVSGPPLLRAAAVEAAKAARFSPTFLEGQPVKVVGVITYNFTLQ